MTNGRTRGTENEVLLSLAEAAHAAGLDESVVRELVGSGQVEVRRLHENGSSLIPSSQIPTLEAFAVKQLRSRGWFNRTWTRVAAALAAVTLVGAAMAALGDVGNQLQRLAPDPDEFEPAADGELLIVVADFSDVDPSTDLDPDAEIAEKISREVERLELSNVRVEYLDEQLERGNRASRRVDEIVDRYKPTIVVWGGRSGARLVVDFRISHPGPAPFISRLQRCRTRTGLCAGTDESDSGETIYPDEISFVTRAVPNQLSFLTLYLLSITELFAGDVDKASTLIQEAIEIAGQDVADADAIAWGHYMHAIYNWFLDDLDSSLISLDRAIDRDPELVDAIALRGEVRLSIGENEGALEDARRVVELDPGEARGYRLSGLGYSALGEYERALGELDRAIELGQEGSLGYRVRGAIHADVGDHEQALRDFDRAIEINSENRLAFLRRGSSYAALGDRERALGDFDRAIEIDPEESSGYRQRGLGYADFGDHEQALRDFDRAIELDPEDGVSYRLRGISYADLGDHLRAVEDFDQAIELDPQDARAFLARGISHAQLGNTEELMEDLTRVGELDLELLQLVAEVLDLDGS